MELFESDPAGVRVRRRDDQRRGAEVRRASADGAGSGRRRGAKTAEGAIGESRPKLGPAVPLSTAILESGPEGAAQATAHGAPDLVRLVRRDAGGPGGASATVRRTCGSGSCKLGLHSSGDVCAADLHLGAGRPGGLVREPGRSWVASGRRCTVLHAQSMASGGSVSSCLSTCQPAGVSGSARAGFPAISAGSSGCSVTTT